MKSQLEFIISKILPECKGAVKVTEDEYEGYFTYNIDVPEDAKPLLIGRNGKTIKAIYNLLYPVSKRERIFNFQLKIKD